MKTKKTVSITAMLLTIIFVIALCSINMQCPKVSANEAIINSNASFNINNTYFTNHLKDKQVTTNESAIKSLIEKRCEVVTYLQTDPNNSLLKNELAEINEEMENLGARHASSDDIATLLGLDKEKITVNRVGPPTTPSDTDTVDWSYYQYQKKYLNKTYDIFELTASPTTTPGLLYNAVHENNIYTSKNLIENIIDIYKDKVIDSIVGASKILSWLPYEILFPDGSSLNYSSNMYESTLIGNTVMMYTFIFHEKFNAWELVMTTHFTRVLSNTQIYYFAENGTPLNSSFEKNFNVHSLYYDNVNQAISYFRKYKENKMHTNVPTCYNVNGITEWINEEKSVYLPFKFFSTPAMLY